jgi:hypothetical protein
MTTQEQPTQTQAIPTDAELSPAAADPVATEGQSASPETELTSASVAPAAETTASQPEARETAAAPDVAAAPETAAAPDVAAAPETAAAPEVATDQSLRSLFADGDLSGLRSRWDDVQASFVDDPRECVHKADGLVSDVVEQLTAGFSQARTRLEEQWDRGEEASTEDLRLALKGYREFFQRLLAV